MNSAAESDPGALAARHRRRRRGLQVAGVLAALVALYWVLGTLLAPVLIQRMIESHEPGVAGARLHVHAVRVQPFLLRVELADLSVSVPDGPGAIVAPRAWLEWRPVARLAIETPHAIVKLPPCCGHDFLQQAVLRLATLFTARVPLRLHELTVRDGRVVLLGGEGLAERRWTVHGIRIHVQDLAPEAGARYAIEVGDAAGVHLALEGHLAPESHQARGTLVATVRHPDAPDVDGARTFAEGTFTAFLEPAEAALRVGIQLAPDEMPRAGESSSLAARLEYVPAGGVLQLEGVPADALSAIAERVIGRGLAAGRVDVAIEQRRVNGQFEGALQLAAEGLRLAGVVEGVVEESSLELAVALLEDAHGRHALRAPLTVAADDDFGPAVEQALQEALARLAGDPFAALGAVVGRPGEAMRDLAFRPGSAEPDESLERVLDSLAEGLEARPALAVVIPAGYHRTHDRDALAARQVELHVGLATAEAAFRTRPAPLDFASARVQDVLEEFAGERLAAARIASLRARFEDEENAAYYRALFDALVKTEPIADAALARLARFRSHAVRDGLTERGIAAERIVLGKVSATAMAATDRVLLQAELKPVARRAASRLWPTTGPGDMLAAQ